MDVARLKRYALVPIDRDEPRYRTPLVRDARGLARDLDADAEVILLGSVASGKYVDPLGDGGAVSAFPRSSWARRMSQGGFPLRCVAEGRSSRTSPSGASRRGRRPPRLIASGYKQVLAGDLGAVPPEGG